MDTNPQSSDNQAGVVSPAAPGIWGIIFHVFSSPRQAFEDFKVKPRILWPMIVIIVFSVIAAVVSAPLSAKMQYDMMKTSTTLPPQALEVMRQNAAHPNLLQTALGAPITVLIISIIAALIAWFLGRVVFGGEARFKATWGVELLAMVISTFGGLLRIPLVLIKGSMYVSYGLAALMPGKDFTSMLYMILYYFDAFAIWSIIAGGIGFGIIFGISRGKGIAVAAISSCLLITFSIIMSIVGMGFAGIDVSFF